MKLFLKGTFCGYLKPVTLSGETSRSQIKFEMLKLKSGADGPRNHLFWV